MTWSWKLPNLPNAWQEARQLYAVDRADFVIVRKVTAHSDGPEYFPVGIQDEDATGHWNDTALGDADQRAVKSWGSSGTLRERAPSSAHSERAPRLAQRNIRSENARMVLSLECNEMATGIQHRDGHRFELELFGALQRSVDHPRGCFETE
jgi:hypothetical protein